MMSVVASITGIGIKLCYLATDGATDAVRDLKISNRFYMSPWHLKSVKADSAWQEILFKLLV